MTLQELKSRLDQMSPLKVQFVARVVDALLHPPQTHVREEGTWLTGSPTAKRLSESTVHISKLTEAAWIQDARTPADRRERTLRLFREYAKAVDSIVMLRAFRTEGVPDRYQLVEIPTSLFASIQDAPLDSFQSDAPVVPCHSGDRVVAHMALDRSDAKVTIRRVDLSACTIHAEWVRSGR